MLISAGGFFLPSLRVHGCACCGEGAQKPIEKALTRQREGLLYGVTPDRWASGPAVCRGIFLLGFLHLLEQV